ncbi:MAG TPA: sugar transferase [Polyangiaceae bacterium LLY-WYZ-15_(1-7)]|nr:sugar transferase [Polyangiaceae bacterium LLY-WYZ-15_(1-7)]
MARALRVPLASHLEPHDGRATAGADRRVRPTSTASVTSAPQRWQSRYKRRLWVSDLVVLVWVVFGTQIFWFGTGNAAVSLAHDVRFTVVSYWSASALLVLLWWWALSLADSRSHRVIGTGSAEYIRVIDSSIRLFGVIAIFAFLFGVDIARGYLLISLPLGVGLLVLVRWLWRHWLFAKRHYGQYMSRVLLVGSESSVTQIASELQRTPRAGYRVVGACIPSGRVADTIPGTGVPVMGNVDAVEHAITATQADTVAVTSADELPPDKVKQISWNLEAGKQHLVLAPSIVDIAGPRIHIRPVSGLPLIHVETPRFSLGQRLLKRSFDLIAAIGIAILISPVLLIVAIAVSWTSVGPILYRSERIGMNGMPFRMLKFRSMRVGADKELKALLEAQGTSEKPLFKVKDDPRITPVGRFIRKYSLDELPQIFNVIGGSMSLVGPRPQIAAEVALYSEAAKRRLLTRPGITGLWQVSGRSALDWDAAVRLDLYYVENWSLASDLAILLKTARAVLAPGETAH